MESSVLQVFILGRKGNYTLVAQGLRFSVTLFYEVVGLIPNDLLFYRL